jgi:hypothetical protein
VVLFVAASLVGTIPAVAAEIGGVVPRPVYFDNQVVPTDCGCGEPQPACHEAGDSCGCGGHHDDGCCHHGHHGRHDDHECGLLDGHWGCDCDECCGCADCCGLLDDCHCDPWLRFRAEFLPLHRRTSDENVNFAGLFTTEDFDFTFEPGGRLAAEVRVCCDCSLEASYLGLYRWADELQDVNGNFSASYVSQLQGGEVNFWMPVRWRFHRVKAAFTFGTKYLDLHEELNIVTLAGTLADIETDNRVLAPQAGFMLSGSLHRGFGWRWDAKGGVGANLSSQNINTATQNLPRQEDSDAVFVGDTNVAFSYQLTCNTSIYAGYYLLWVDGLALAPQQFNVPVSEVSHNAFLLFQGGFAGVETNW